jgi:hypothetical protein
MPRDREYAARLFLDWLNDRYGRNFALTERDGDLWHASDSTSGSASDSASEPPSPQAERGQGVRLYVAPLIESDEAWDQRRSELEARLDASRPGSYVLWVPPEGELPAEEPDESEWVRRVVLGASRLASGRRGEARLPVRLMVGKVRDEGGYATVTGGLGRYWTYISQRLDGSFYLDSRGLHRFTQDEKEREALYDHIGMLSQGLQTGDAAEFEHEDAWSVQRLPRGAAAEGLTDGWAITGSPPGFDPNDGAHIRRILRRRLAEAGEVLKDVRGAIKALVLIGAYEYMEYENAGPALRGFDPSLTLPFDIIGLVSDAEVKPILLSRSLDLSNERATT